MGKTNWLLYGAYGYSGELMAQAALERGHRPVLAGRSAAKLKPLAERLNLEYRVVDLASADLPTVVRDFALVLHAAGPFIHTSPPMVRACLQTHTHYLDITGEVPVFEQNLALDAAARAAGIALISGVGFDVIPSDNLLAHVAQKLPGATELELAFASLGGVSTGTAKTALELLQRGTLRRRNGQLRAGPLGQGARQVRLPKRTVWTLSIPWGDLATAYRTTGIPNITVYLAMSRQTINLLRWAGPLMQGVTAFTPARRLIQAMVERTLPRGPDAAKRQTTKAYLWARAAHRDAEAQAWLITPEGYALTAEMSIRSVERVLQGGMVGALTPTQAFGKDFILELPGVKRLDELPPA